MAVNQNSVSSVCQKEHRMFYAPFTRGREQVYVYFYVSNRTAQDGVWANQDEGTNVRFILHGYTGVLCETWRGVWCSEWKWVRPKQRRVRGWVAEIICTIDLVNQEYFLWKGFAVDLMHVLRHGRVGSIQPGWQVSIMLRLIYLNFLF